MVRGGLACESRRENLRPLPSLLRSISFPLRAEFGMAAVEVPRELHATLISTQATISFATCLAPNQRLQYLLCGPVLRLLAPMDALPCLASCFTLVL